MIKQYFKGSLSNSGWMTSGTGWGELVRKTETHEHSVKGYQLLTKRMVDQRIIETDCGW